MPLAPLATPEDLTERGITGDPAELVAFLDAASAEVRNAAGVPISLETFTATIPGRPFVWLTLPGAPVRSVASVAVDGEVLPSTEWRVVGSRIWRACGWQADPCAPSNVTVTVTGGLDPVPADMVDLVCAMVGHAAAEASTEGGGGYASRGDLAGVRIDDYSEQYITAAGERLAGPMELPQATRDRLAARFGGGAYVVGTGR